MIYELPCKDSLTDTYDLILSEIIRGAKDRKSPLHTGVLCTQGFEFPESRTVVLRRFSTPSLELSFFTDLRSSKVTELQKNPQCSLLFYNPQKNYQIRFKGRMQISQPGPETQRDWNSIPLNSRKSYMTLMPPGEPLDQCGSGLPQNFENQSFDLNETEPYSKNFAVLNFNPSLIDWLYLAPTGHRRAQFKITQGTPTESNWLTP